MHKHTYAHKHTYLHAHIHMCVNIYVAINASNVLSFVTITNLLKLIKMCWIAAFHYTRHSTLTHAHTQTHTHMLYIALYVVAVEVLIALLVSSASFTPSPMDWHIHIHLRKRTYIQYIPIFIIYLNLSNAVISQYNGAFVKSINSLVFPFGNCWQLAWCV